MRIVNERAPRIAGQADIFQAEDGDGALNLWVTATRWEELCLQAPEPATDEDRLDFALSMIEAVGADGEVGVSSYGSRILFVG